MLSWVEKLLGAQEFQPPEGSSMAAYGAGLVENAVRKLADARLRQRETLVDVAVKQTQHLAAIHIARVFHAHIARWDGQQSPQGLLKRRVHSMNCIFH